MARDPWILVLVAWVVSVVATVGSLNYSGIGFIGWYGLMLTPCELCWFQRIFMYPIAGILAHAYWKQSNTSTRIGLAMAVPGLLLATYHSLLQYLPQMELGRCTIGSCTAIQYRVMGLSIPNQSLLAFAGIVIALGMAEYWSRASRPRGGSP